MASKTGKDSQNGENRTLNITVMRNSNNHSVGKHREKDDDKVVKQVVKVNSLMNDTSVEERRDGSVIFVGNRKNTVERVKAKRDSSHSTKVEGDKHDGSIAVSKVPATGQPSK